MKLFGKTFSNTTFICVLTTLAIIVALNNRSILEFSINTSLGRLVTLAILIGLTSYHKLCGLLVLISIIVIYNHKAQFEGLTLNANSMTKPKSIGAALKRASKEAEAPAQAADAVDPTENTPVEVDAETDQELQNKLADLLKQMKKVKPKAKAKTAPAIEGFCMSDRELHLLRGKRPNSISTNNLRTQADDVSPSDTTDFASGPSLF